MPYYNNPKRPDRRYHAMGWLNSVSFVTACPRRRNHKPEVPLKPRHIDPSPLLPRLNPQLGQLHPLGPFLQIPRKCSAFN
jgi:hypothetical protein